MYFPELKRQERETHHSLSYSAKVRITGAILLPLQAFIPSLVQALIFALLFPAIPSCSSTPSE